MDKWARIKYQPAVPLGTDGKAVTSCTEHISLSRKASGEGIVLLKNDGVLPLKKGAKVAVFGKAQIDYVKGGGGSGNVYCRYIRNIYDGLKVKEKEEKLRVYNALSAFYEDYVSDSLEAARSKTTLGENDVMFNGDPAFEPGLFAEPIVPDSLYDSAAAFTDTAIITICRFSGEGWDRSSSKGDFYLSETEEKMVKEVCKRFKNVAVVLNVGGIVDTEWFKDNDSIGAAIFASNGGMEGGLAIADVLCGDVNPSGHLVDTFAKSFDDYPSSATFNESDDYIKYYDDIYVGYRYFETIPKAAERVCYPFGFGLSYTSFALDNVHAMDDGKTIFVTLDVKNTGKYAGKEVIQVYTSAPQGKLGKPARELKAFAKTKLLAPNESQKLILSFEIASMASYDDMGKVAPSAYILEKGVYEIHVGTSVRDTVKTEYEYVVNDDYIITEQLSCQTPAYRLEKRLCSDGTYESLPVSERKPFNYAPIAPVAAKKSEQAIPFSDVYKGKASLDEFIAQMTEDELIELLGGKPNTGVANTGGIGGSSNNELDIPCAMTADGPAGVRIHADRGVRTTAWPCATLIACTWDTELMREIGSCGALEMKENNLSIWLTPAMNIHRSPLCGRNFEYFSEDPLISGKMAAAKVRGIQSHGIACAIKHFVCNNKEVNRMNSDSIVSERALREIYIKGFEICVKEADPWTVMTSYNKMNGVHTSENYDLITNILRGEWGFGGMVMTDWNNNAAHYEEAKAGNDIRMPFGHPEKVKESNPDRGVLESCARNILELLLKLD